MLWERELEWECCGTGGVGKTVDRTAYGQYERCSFSTSNCLVGRDFPGTVDCPASGINAHSPMRRWQREQCRKVDSDLGFTADSMEVGRVSARMSGGGRVGDEDDGEKGPEGVRARTGVPGAEGAMEEALDRDGSRLRSRGGGGGGNDHPKRETRTAASDGSVDEDC